MPNFTSDALNIKLCVKDKKIAELTGTKYLFGQLLYLASMNCVDLKHVFAYPLTPVPLAWAGVDGSMNKTQTSKLIAYLATFTYDGCIFC